MGIWSATKNGHNNVNRFSDTEFASFIILNTTSEDKTNNICGTALEQELLKAKIISAKDVGQYDCSNIGVISKDKIREISKTVFGPNYEFNLSKANSTTSAFYYSTTSQVGVFRYSGAGYTEYYKMGTYTENNNTLTIEVLPLESYESQTKYNLVFTKTDDNYYLTSITEK